MKTVGRRNWKCLIPNCIVRNSNIIRNKCCLDLPLFCDSSATLQFLTAFQLCPILARTNLNGESQMRSVCQSIGQLFYSPFLRTRKLEYFVIRKANPSFVPNYYIKVIYISTCMLANLFEFEALEY